MKNPHDKSEYVKVDDKAPEQPLTPDGDGAAEQDGQNVDATERVEKTEKGKKPKYSGAYYYVDKDETRLATMSFLRTSLTILAFILQMVALIFPEQAGAMYVSKHIG
ncbi:MAG: hypothetical protein K2O39_01840, partial [Clostridiales bacterium]|nr:hypothetical protein [Clostridiales bacterium]